MKKLLIAPLILIGACAACCALPLVPALLAGLLTASAGVAIGSWKIALGMVVALALLGRVFALLVRAKKTRNPLSTPCQVACATPPAPGPCACQPGQQG